MNPNFHLYKHYQEHYNHGAYIIHSYIQRKGGWGGGGGGSNSASVTKSVRL